MSARNTEDAHTGVAGLRRGGKKRARGRAESGSPVPVDAHEEACAAPDLVAFHVEGFAPSLVNPGKVAASRADAEARKNAVAEFKRLNPTIVFPLDADGTSMCAVAKSREGVFYAEAVCTLTCAGHTTAKARGYGGASTRGGVFGVLPAEEARALWEARAKQLRGQR